MLSGTITPLLHYSIPPPLWRRHELLPGTQFRIFGEENFDTVNPTGLQFAGGDRFVVNDLFAWIDREIADFVGESAVLRPSRQDLAGRVKQMNIDSLRGWEIKRNRRTANIPQYRLDPQLAHFRKPDWFRRDLHFQQQTAQV